MAREARNMTVCFTIICKKGCTEGGIKDFSLSCKISGPQLGNFEKFETNETF